MTTREPMMLPVPGSRSVKEWIGKTPDSVPPPRVKLRVLERYEFKCYLSGRPIREGDQWDAEHIIAITNGGENRESNLAPALKEPHRAKTRVDMRIKSKRAKSMKRRYGLKKSRNPMPGGKRTKFKRKFDGTVIDRFTGRPIGRKKK